MKKKILIIGIIGLGILVLMPTTAMGQLDPFAALNDIQNSVDKATSMIGSVVIIGAILAIVIIILLGVICYYLSTMVKLLRMGPFRQ